MKEEITIPVLKEEDFVAANKRRDTYALTRDKQMQESNAAIALRLIANESNKVKCSKCGKEFESAVFSDEIQVCSECK